MASAPVLELRAQSYTDAIAIMLTSVTTSVASVRPLGNGDAVGLITSGRSDGTYDAVDQTQGAVTLQCHPEPMRRAKLCLALLAWSLGVGSAGERRFNS